MRLRPCPLPHTQAGYFSWEMGGLNWCLFLHTSGATKLISFNKTRLKRQFGPASPTESSAISLFQLLPKHLLRTSPISSLCQGLDEKGCDRFHGFSNMTGRVTGVILDAYDFRKNLPLPLWRALHVALGSGAYYSQFNRANIFVPPGRRRNVCCPERRLSADSRSNQITTHIQPQRP